MRGLLALVCVMAMSCSDVRAQQANVTWEVGALAGRFNGMSLKAYPESETPERSIDIQFSVNGRDFIALRAHVLTETRLPNSPLTLYLGPGATLGTNDSELFLGPAAEIGVFFGIAQYRVFLQAMPQLHITPRLEGSILAAVGFRLSI